MSIQLLRKRRKRKLEAVKFWRKRKRLDKIRSKRKRTRKQPILSGAGSWSVKPPRMRKRKRTRKHDTSRGAGSGSKKYSTASTSLKRSDYFTGKNILQREKEHRAIFILAHFM